MTNCANSTLRFIVLQNNTYLLFLQRFKFNIFSEIRKASSIGILLYQVLYFISEELFNSKYQNKKYRDKTQRYSSEVYSLQI